MKPRSSYWLASILSLVGASVFAFGGCSVTEGTTEEDGHVDTADQELTAEQCNYFAVNGKVQICHRTGSVSNPYRVLKISEQACINAHALHAGDYVAVNDPTCQGGGCLPEAAPCDATLPCCEGFSCTNGTCTANVSDHCSPSPCQNGSTCASDANSYTCTCIAGYTGTNCEIEIDECAVNPCVHGVCLDAINAYECQCPVGWTGTNCEIDINECDTNPCINGDCLDLVGGYECSCLPGWEGYECQNDINECASNPCLNGGTCTNGVNSYTCACPAGWDGTNCENDINECDANPCVHGECEDQIAQYECLCNPGWDGNECQNNINECASNPCLNGGTCADGANSYTCTCPAGWTGTNCETPDGPGCPCDGMPDWESGFNGTIVNDGRCTDYSFPAPCMNAGTYAVATFENGATLGQLIAGGEPGSGFCGLQLMNQHSAISCSGGNFLIQNGSITEAEGMACNARIQNWAAAQNVTCN